MSAELQTLASDATDRIAAASTLEDLEQIRVEVLGRKSKLKDIQGSMRDLDDAGRKELGAALNAFKKDVETALAARHAVLQDALLAAQIAEETLDLTMPARLPVPGRSHVMTQTVDRMVDIFLSLGYEVCDGPEIESSVYNFDMLNIPFGHPAREEMDTIYVDTDRTAPTRTLLRTHTSPVQARLLTTRDLPLAAVIPGRVFRQDTVDATHSPVFGQFEGILVDRNVTMADLRGTLLSFAKRMFGDDRDVRLLPDMFPFTEPSAQVEVSWPRPDGTTGWLEILGAGMIDPAVLEACGKDPNVWSGFAFGMGVDRVAMLRHHIADIRHLYEGDLRFASAF